MYVLFGCFLNTQYLFLKLFNEIKLSLYHFIILFSSKKNFKKLSKTLHEKYEQNNDEISEKLIVVKFYA